MPGANGRYAFYINKEWCHRADDSLGELDSIAMAGRATAPVSLCTIHGIVEYGGRDDGQTSSGHTGILVSDISRISSNDLQALTLRSNQHLLQRQDNIAVPLLYCRTVLYFSSYHTAFNPVFLPHVSLPILLKLH